MIISNLSQTGTVNPANKCSLQKNNNKKQQQRDIDVTLKFVGQHDWGHFLA